MNKNLLKKITAFSLLFAILCFSSVVTAAAATDEKGTITVEVNQAAEGIGLTLYTVGDYVNGEYALNSDFKNCGVDLSNVKTADDAKNAAGKFEDYAETHSLSGTVARVALDGKAYFSNLDINKLYLIVQSTDKNGLIIQPMLITVPYYTDGNKITDINTSAKFVDSEAKQYRGTVILNKLGYESIPLQGAVFTFQKKVYFTELEKVPQNANIDSDNIGTFYWKVISDNVVTQSNGQAVMDKLRFGTYRFIETKAPKNYILDSTPHEVNVSEYGTVKMENGVYVANGGAPIDLKVINIEESHESSVPESSIPESSIPESSVPESSTPVSESSIVESSTPESSKDIWHVLTGDDMKKYIIIGAAVVISLGVIIVLLLTRKKDNK